MFPNRYSRQACAVAGWLICLVAGAVASGLMGTTAPAADGPPVTVSPGSASDFALVRSGSAATVVYSAADAQVVGIAAGLFADDVQRVTGLRPPVRTSASGVSGPLVLVGTVGKSPDLDGLIAAGKVDVSAIQGDWERYRIQVVGDPFPGVAQALVIAGSDRRGTAYGVFSLSEAMGVSPWYWWADVPAEAKTALCVGASPFTSSEPSVRYRGIFINDEDWGIQEWAEKNYEGGTNEVKDIGPKTYAKVCELLLRLKANCLWPAMHDSTKAFNHYPDNKTVADSYAIVMGSSHAEPMLRNNVYEWYNDIDPATGAVYSSGSWDYSVNKAGVYRYWDQRALNNGAYENLYTLGKRGIHDSGMVEGSNDTQKAGWLNTIFTDQRQILANRVNADVTKIPQIFVPYKEVLSIYDTGLVNVPDDVTLVWPDDNFGYIRRLSSPAEQARGGGGGVYYHISYWGSPADYLWVCSTPPALIWEEMTKAYRYNCGRVWILNAGDIKPGEICTEFFLRLAWNVGRYDENAQTAWLTEWATREFGAANAAEIAAVLNAYYQLGYTRKPEHMNWQDQDPATPAGPYPLFSHVHNGGEAGVRLARYADLVQRANAVYAALPAAKQNAFYQTVLYPLRGTDAMNRKFLNAGRAYVAAQQGRNTVAAQNAAAQQGYNDIQTETAFYNALNGGKWNEMMDSKPRALAVFNAPTLPAAPAASTGLGVAVEGRLEPANPTTSTALTLDAATAGTVTAPMVVATVAGRRAIYTPNGAGTAPSAGAAGYGKAVYTFNVPAAATYTLSCEVNCPTLNDDSFYIQFDAGTATVWNNLSNDGIWSWATFGTASLTAGTHTLTVYQREDGAAMATIRLVPSGIAVFEDQAAGSFQFPEFNGFTRRSYFLDLFNLAASGSPASWTVTPGASWVLVSKTSGTTATEERLQVSIDWPRAPRTGSFASSVTVASAGNVLAIPVNVWNPPDALPAEAAWVEDNNAVAIEAEHYSARTASADAAWSLIPGLGAGDGVMYVSPPTAASRTSASAIVSSSPCLSYNVYLRQAGTVNVTVSALPTLPVNLSRGLRYAVSFDGDTPQIVDMTRTSGSGDAWSRSVLRSRIAYTTAHTLAAAGSHTLKVWMADPGVVLDRFVVSRGPLPYTYGGAPESAAVSHGALTVQAGGTYTNPAGQATVYDALNNQGTLNASGTLTVAGSVVNGGTMRLYAGARLQAGGQFVNNGVLDIMSWDGTLPANFVNNGVVLDRSAVKVDGLAFSGRDLAVTLRGYAGHVYQLQQSPDGSLTGGWTDVGSPATGGDAPITFTITGAGSLPRQFYRVRLAQ